MRVHVFSAGKEEQAIAAGYHQKTESLEEDGYSRIAVAMRALAKVMSGILNAKPRETRTGIKVW